MTPLVPRLPGVAEELVEVLEVLAVPVDLVEAEVLPSPLHFSPPVHLQLALATQCHVLL